MTKTQGWLLLALMSMLIAAVLWPAALLAGAAGGVGVFFLVLAAYEDK